MIPVIDTHGFVGKNRDLGIDYSLDQLRSVRPFYFDLRFLAVSASRETNFLAADIVRDNPDILAGAYLQVMPIPGHPLGYTPPEEIHALLGREEIIGLKYINYFWQKPNNSPVLKPYIELAVERGIPFLFHCCATKEENMLSSPEINRELVGDNPGLDVVLAHFGGLNPDYSDANLLLARECPNAYLNTTGMTGEVRRLGKANDGTFFVREHFTDIVLRHRWQAIIDDAMSDKVIREKVLFGSDFPFLSHSLYPAGSYQEQIMENAKNLFGLKQSYELEPAKTSYSQELAVSR